MQLQKVHNIDFLDNTLPKYCADLIIADPPYFEVKGKFDFVWSSFDEYLKDVEKWVLECKRLLKPNGTLFWYGHAKKIAYTQVILDKYFRLENALVWRKKECQTMRSNPQSLRCFAPITERILMYSNFNQNENDWKNNNASVYYHGFEPIRLYFRDEIQKVGIKKVAHHLGISDRAIGHWVSKSQWYMPSQENVEKCQELGVFLEYEKVRRTFNLNTLQTDVLDYSQEAHITKNYDHETKKPETLTRNLVLTCTNRDDLVVVPFAGSGTECAMAVREHRRFVGFDISQKYTEMANDRVNKEFHYSLVS